MADLQYFTCLGGRYRWPAVQMFEQRLDIFCTFAVAKGQRIHLLTQGQNTLECFFTLAGRFYNGRDRYSGGLRNRPLLTK